MTRKRVALIGPDQQENLALGYLAAVAEKAGHSVEIIRYNTRRDMESCTAAVLASRADLVGLGIAFQYAIADYLDLARSLRKRGYRGHITCGGHVPTFCHEELLRDVPAIDTAVRHEGEETFLEMLAMLADGEEPRGIAGLVWRENGMAVRGPVRPPVVDLERLPLPRRRQKPLAVGGVPIAFMIASRGCIGECAYCSIRAFGKDAGGPRFRMRDVDAVADEIAALYHESGIRVILMQDDLFVLPNEKKTIERMERIARAIRARGVDRMLFWIKARPETVTPAIALAAREMGTIHLFLGIENASHERLKYLGRTHTPEDNARAISLCLEQGIRPSFNLMLFDPDCVIDDIRSTIDFAERYLKLPWNICRTEIYSGTKLLSRLQGQGRLEGDYRTYGYKMRDLRAEIMFRILRVCFQDRAFAYDSLLNKMISLSFARQVHESFLPGPGTDDLSLKVDELAIGIYQDTVDELRRVLDFAVRVDVDDTEGVQRFAVETALAVNGRDDGYLRRFEGLFHLVNARGERVRG